MRGAVPCGACGRVFDTTAGRDHHWRDMHDALAACSDCSRTFLSTQSRDAHWRAKHRHHSSVVHAQSQSVAPFTQSQQYQWAWGNGQQQQQQQQPPPPPQRVPVVARPPSYLQRRSPAVTANWNHQQSPTANPQTTAASPRHLAQQGGNGRALSTAWSCLAASNRAAYLRSSLSGTSSPNPFGSPLPAQSTAARAPHNTQPNVHGQPTPVVAPAAAGAAAAPVAEADVEVVKETTLEERLAVEWQDAEFRGDVVDLAAAEDSPPPPPAVRPPVRVLKRSIRFQGEQRTTLAGEPQPEEHEDCDSAAVDACQAAEAAEEESRAEQAEFHMRELRWCEDAIGRSAGPYRFDGR